MARFFITGTDTECGKTFVTSALLKYFNQNNQTSQALKPIASGGDEDIIELQKYNFLQNAAINKWCFKEPIAPHIAAEKNNTVIQMAELSQFCNAKNEFTNLFIEGAGGLLAPINSEYTWLDFVKAENLTVILVVGMRLGCINHALLTEKVLAFNKIQTAGWIANCLDNSMEVLQENIDFLVRKMRIPLIATVPYCGNIVEIDW